MEWNMDIVKAEFVVSNATVEKCPKPDRYEYAFIGRSNVGKSSLINMLTNNKKLAKTAARPGKTQLINHFLINDMWYMVDLPGYGYARTSETARACAVRSIIIGYAEREEYSLSEAFSIVNIGNAEVL